MRTFFTKSLAALLLSSSLWLGFSADGRVPIYNAYLQNNLDGNQQNITNVGKISANSLTVQGPYSGLITNVIGGANANVTVSNNIATVSIDLDGLSDEFVGTNDWFNLTNGVLPYPLDLSSATGLPFSSLTGTGNLSLWESQFPGTFQVITNPVLFQFTAQNAVAGWTNVFNSSNTSFTLRLGDLANINTHTYSSPVGGEAFTLFATGSDTGDFLDFDRFGNVRLFGAIGLGLTINTNGQLGGDGFNLTDLQASNIVGSLPLRSTNIIVSINNYSAAQDTNTMLSAMVLYQVNSGICTNFLVPPASPNPFQVENDSTNVLVLTNPVPGGTFKVQSGTNAPIYKLTFTNSLPMKVVTLAQINPTNYIISAEQPTAQGIKNLADGEIATRPIPLGNGTGIVPASSEVGHSGDVSNSPGSTNLILATVVSAGTGTKITFNSKGLVTGSTTLSLADLGFAGITNLNYIRSLITSNGYFTYTTQADLSVTATLVITNLSSGNVTGLGTMASANSNNYVATANAPGLIIDTITTNTVNTNTIITYGQSTFAGFNAKWVWNGNDFANTTGPYNIRFITGSWSVFNNGDTSSPFTSSTTLQSTNWSVPYAGMVSIFEGTILANNIWPPITPATGSFTNQVSLTGDVTGNGSNSIATTLKNTGTAGTYTKTTFDAQGRETGGTTLALTDLPAGTVTNKSIPYLNLIVPGTYNTSQDTNTMVSTNTTYSVTNYGIFTMPVTFPGIITIENDSSTNFIITNSPGVTFRLAATTNSFQYLLSVTNNYTETAMSFQLSANGTNIFIVYGEKTKSELQQIIQSTPLTSLANLPAGYNSGGAANSATNAPDGNPIISSVLASNDFVTLQDTRGQTNSGQTSLTSPNNFYTGQYSNTYVKIIETRGTTNIPITINSTNAYANPFGLHITVTAGTPVITSIDNAFAGMRRGFQLEMHDSANMQLEIVSNSTDGSSAIAYLIGPGSSGYPNNTTNNSTSWIARPPDMRWSDDTIGSENFGGWMDDNGMMWFAAIGDQGTTYYLNFSTAALTSIGMSPDVNVGLNTFPNEIWAVSSCFTPNGNNFGLQFYVHQAAPNESMGILPNGNVAIQFGLTNRHGGILPIRGNVSMPETLSVNTINNPTNPVSWNGSGITNFNSRIIYTNFNTGVQNLNLIWPVPFLPQVGTNYQIQYEFIGTLSAADQIYFTGITTNGATANNVGISTGSLPIKFKAVPDYQ